MTQQEIVDLLQQIHADVLFVKSELITLKSEFANIKFSVADKLMTTRGGRHVASQNAPEPAKIQLLGTIVNDKMVPLVGVNIRVYDGATNEVVATGTSDGSGEWSAYVLHDGPYSIEYKKAGIISKSINVVIPAGKVQYRLGRGR